MALGRQLTGFFTFLAPFNVFWYLFSKVPNEPYIDTDEFPELQVLRDNWTIIRDEVKVLNEQGQLRHGTGVAFSSFYKDDRWRRFYLTWYGRQYSEAKEYLPQTLKMIEGIPSVNAALITRLNPGKTLRAHRDPFSVSLRYHLGLITPNSDLCKLTVDGESYSWRDGEDVIFDETFVHDAANESDQERLILFCDIQRPMRGAISNWCVRHTHKAIGYLAAGSNDETEGDNLFNAFFEKTLAPLSRKTRQLKRLNKELYYTLKYLIFGSIIVAILYL